MDSGVAEPTNVASIYFLVFSVPFSTFAELQHMILGLSQFSPVEMSSDASSAMVNISKDRPTSNELDLRHLNYGFYRELQLML